MCKVRDIATSESVPGLMVRCRVIAGDTELTTNYVIINCNWEKCYKRYKVLREPTGTGLNVGKVVEGGQKWLF